MPKTKETQIEKKDNANKKKRVTKKVTDGDLEKFFNEEFGTQYRDKIISCITMLK